MITQDFFNTNMQYIEAVRDMIRPVEPQVEVEETPGENLPVETPEEIPNDEETGNEEPVENPEDDEVVE